MDNKTPYYLYIMTSSIKPAATVILMREVDEGGFEIFLVKRSSRSSLVICMFFLEES